MKHAVLASELCLKMCLCLVYFYFLPLIQTWFGPSKCKARPGLFGQECAKFGLVDVLIVRSLRSGLVSKYDLICLPTFNLLQLPWNKSSAISKLLSGAYFNRDIALRV